MTFSKEDKAAWQASEIMAELEKMAMNGEIDLPDEAFLPVGEEEDSDEEEWEDEELAKQLGTAADELSGDEEDEDVINEEEAELLESLNSNLFDQISKISCELADKSNIKGAYKVERALQSIKTLLEDNNE